jgi:hypothetical protein
MKWLAVYVITMVCMALVFTARAEANSADIYPLAQITTTTPTFTVRCKKMPWWLLGQTYPTNVPPSIELNTYVCKAIRRLEHHVGSAADRLYDVNTGLQTVLHEGVHVAQGIEALNPFDATVYNEHNAECRGLAAIPAALALLHYQAQFQRNAVAYTRKAILEEDAPYGGRCL